MRAVRLHGRGGPEQLIYEEAPKPAPGTDEVLVRVRAVSLTPAELTWAETYTTRDGRSRLPSIPGHELSGVVETLGRGVTDVRVGEEIYALVDFDRDGGEAEYVTMPARDVAPKPRSLDFIQAASLPLSGLTAWQGLFEHGQLRAGQRVLIHGAAGGVGSLAVQMAKWRGAYVVATASARQAEFLRSLGVDEFINYETTSFDEVVRDLDLVLDPIGGEALARSWKVLRPGGLLVTLPAPLPEHPAPPAGVRGLFFIVRPSRADLIEIARLVDAGALHPIVGDVLPLAQAREAFERGLRGHLKGKLVLQV